MSSPYIEDLLCHIVDFLFFFLPVCYSSCIFVWHVIDIFICQLNLSYGQFAPVLLWIHVVTGSIKPKLGPKVHSSARNFWLLKMDLTSNFYSKFRIFRNLVNLILPLLRFSVKLWPYFKIWLHLKKKSPKVSGTGMNLWP